MIFRLIEPPIGPELSNHFVVTNAVCRGVLAKIKKLEVDDNLVTN